MPGRVPWVQVAPLSPLLEKPTPVPPPSKNRPSWAAATMVLPKAKVSGSTVALCWLVLLGNGSWIIFSNGTPACAAGRFSSITVAVAVTTAVVRADHLIGLMGTPQKVGRRPE